MVTRRIARGSCLACLEVFSKSAMPKHLEGCTAGKAARGKPSRAFLLVAEGGPEYFLHILAPARATFGALDSLLREVWLECCDHLSAFTVGGAQISIDESDGGFDLDYGPSGRSMATRLGNVLVPGLVFIHEYDFGTTTRLRLRVLREVQRVAPAVQVLARNEPPTIPCGICGKPATQVCGSCSFEPEGWLCKAHGRQHGCGEDELLPVVNSPRTGMCGYAG